MKLFFMRDRSSINDHQWEMRKKTRHPFWNALFKKDIFNVNCIYRETKLFCSLKTHRSTHIYFNGFVTVWNIFSKYLLSLTEELFFKIFGRKNIYKSIKYDKKNNKASLPVSHICLIRQCNTPSAEEVSFLSSYIVNQRMAHVWSYIFPSMLTRQLTNSWNGRDTKYMVHFFRQKSIMFLVWLTV